MTLKKGEKTTCPLYVFHMKCPWLAAAVGHHGLINGFRSPWCFIECYYCYSWASISTIPSSFLQPPCPHKHTMGLIARTFSYSYPELLLIVFLRFTQTRIFSSVSGDIVIIIIMSLQGWDTKKKTSSLRGYYNIGDVTLSGIITNCINC